MYTHHKFDHVFDPGGPPSVSYLICTLPRTGSSLLCELLCLTGVAGAPTEFFDVEQMRDFERRWATQGFDEYLERLLVHKTSPNGVFGAKAHHPQLIEAAGDRDPTSFLPDLHCVFLTRRDHLRQAVSYARAVQSGQWASTHESRGRERYRRRQVAELQARIEREEQDWERWFRRHRIDPVRIDYETLVADPLAAVDAVLDLVGVTRDPATVMTPTLQVQSDGHTDEWVQRHRRGRRWSRRGGAPPPAL